MVVGEAANDRHPRQQEWEEKVTRLALLRSLRDSLLETQKLTLQEEGGARRLQEQMRPLPTAPIPDPLLPPGMPSYLPSPLPSNNLGRRPRSAFPLSSHSSHSHSSSFAGPSSAVEKTPRRRPASQTRTRPATTRTARTKGSNNNTSVSSRKQPKTELRPRRKSVPVNLSSAGRNKNPKTNPQNNPPSRRYHPKIKPPVPRQTHPPKSASVSEKPNNNVSFEARHSQWDQGGLYITGGGGQSGKARDSESIVTHSVVDGQPFRYPASLQPSQYINSLPAPPALVTAKIETTLGCKQCQILSTRLEIQNAAIMQEIERSARSETQQREVWLQEHDKLTARLAVQQRLAEEAQQKSYELEERLKSLNDLKDLNVIASQLVEERNAREAAETRAGQSDALLALERGKRGALEQTLTTYYPSSAHGATSSYLPRTDAPQEERFEFKVFSSFLLWQGYSLSPLQS